MVLPPGFRQGDGMDGFLSTLDPGVVYLVVGLLAFGESAAFLGLVLPGEASLVAAAALAHTIGVDPFGMLLVAGVASGAGGLVGFEIGRRKGATLLAWRPIERRFGPAVIRTSEQMVGKRAQAVVVLSRFNQVTRAVVPVLAGMSPMARSRFGIANGIGALLWSAAFVAIGYLAGEWWRTSSGSVQMVSAAGFAAVVGAWVAFNKATRHNGRHADSPGL